MSEQDTAKLMKQQVGKVAADRVQSGSKAKAVRLGHFFSSDGFAMGDGQVV